MRSKRYLKFIVLPIVFLAALFVSDKLINHETPVERQALEASALPVLQVSYDGTAMNELHGYTSEMDVSRMRGVITPMTDDYRVLLEISGQEAAVTGVRYRVLEPDGSRTAEEGRADLRTEEGGETLAEISFSRELTDNTDYVCEIIATDEEGREVYYYTRIGNYSAAHFDECLDLAMKLHRAALKGKTSVLADSMEPMHSSEAEDFSHATINSSLELICFEGLEAERAGKPVVTVQEMNNEYSLILLDYRMKGTKEDDPALYEVRECYRLRYSTQKVYLLNFDRTMEQVYLGGLESGTGRIDLGIRSRETEFDFSESGNRVSFIQNGQLWEYGLDDHTMARVYGFRAMDGKADPQNDCMDHAIRILRTDESGNMDFAVIGYQNRGSNEGRSGIGLFHYDSAALQVRELMFLERDAAPGLAEKELGDLAYLSGSGMFYFSAGGKIWAADTQKGTLRVFLEALSEEYAISENGRFLAWTDPALDGRASVLHLTDLEHEETADLGAEDGNYVRPLGFMENDCIYGLAREKDLKRAAYDPGLFPMQKVVIYSCENKEQLKEYSRKGYFYSGAKEEEKGNLSLACLRYKDGIFHEAADQSIKNQQMISQEEVSLQVDDSDAPLTRVQLQLLGTIPEKSVRVAEPEYAFGGSTAVLDPEMDPAGTYYVSARGGVVLLTSDLAKAAAQADADCGVVTDYQQQVVWSRAKSASQQVFALPEAGGGSAGEKAVRSMLAALGGTPGEDVADSEASVQEVLQAGISRGEILDLTGCRVDLVLYYVSGGYPVYAKTAGGAALINGYTTSSISWYDYGSGEEKTASIEEAEAFFAEAGSVYYGYLG